MFETEKHLTSDRESHLIHIIDQDGCYLRYIDMLGGLHLWGLQIQPHRSPVEQIIQR